MSSEDVFASSFVWNVVAQVVGRGATFTANVFVARSVASSDYGIAHVLVAPLHAAVIALARDPARRACSRVTLDAPKADLTASVRISQLAVPIGLLAGVFLTESVLFTRRVQGAASAQTAFAARVSLLGAVFELAAEPMHTRAHAAGKYHVRSLAESAGHWARTIVLVVCCRLVESPTVAIFGYAGVAYGVAVLAVYATLSPASAALEWARTSSEVTKENNHGSKRPSSSPLWGVYRSFAQQSVQKAILAEGEKLLLSITAPDANLGPYAVASNLGSLVVRTVFLPTEEAAFTTLSRGGADAFAIYCHLQRLMLVISIFAAAAGPPVCTSLLALLYGQRYTGGVDGSEAVACLTWYAWYVAALAANGVAESHVHATAVGAELSRANAVLAAATVAHIALCSFLASPLGELRLGMRPSVGLVIAGLVGSVARLVYNARYAAMRFRTTPGSPSLVPSTFTFIVGGCLAMASRALGHMELQPAIHAVGAVALGGIALVMVTFVEKDAIMALVRGRYRRSTRQHSD